MNTRIGRAAVAGLAAIALLGVGVSVASAADTIPSDPKFGGTLYLADPNTELALSATNLVFNSQIIAQVSAGDANTGFPAPTDATGAATFIAPQGHEGDPTYWNASAPNVILNGANIEPNLTLTNQINPGGSNSSPNGQGAVKAAGGSFSIGLAFTKANGTQVADKGLFYIHITMAPGGAYTYAQVAVAKTATTTTLAVPATAPAENVAFSLSASVSPAAATGSVEFFDGATSLGTSAVSTGTATLNVAAGLAGGTHSITAQYLGDSSYAASTSAAASIVIATPPVTTTLAVTATSASGFGGNAVVYTATVTPASAAGSVAFSALKAGDTVPVALGSFPVSAGVATTTLSGLGAGSWTVTGAFTGTGAFQNSTSTASLSLVVDPNSNSATPDPQTVTVVVPKGALTITTPWTATNPLALGTLQLNQANSTYELAAPVNFASSTDIAKGIKIVNSRPDQPHFTAQVASTNFTSTGGSFVAGKASLVNVAAVAVPGNALLPTDVVPANVTALANTAQTFATYAASNLGTAWLSADFNVKGVPSSTPSGTYTATVTFTAF